MNQYNPTQFSNLHQQGNINETVNYLQSLSSMTEQDITDVILRMMRCNDTDAWTKPILPILISKNHEPHTFLKIFQKASLTRAIEQSTY
jgi:hypothetical protein